MRSAFDNTQAFREGWGLFMCDDAGHLCLPRPKRHAEPVGLLIRRSQRPPKSLRDRRRLGTFARQRLQRAHVILRPRPNLRRLLRCHSSLQATHFSTLPSFNIDCCNFATKFLCESSMICTYLLGRIPPRHLPRISRCSFSQAGRPPDIPRVFHIRPRTEHVHHARYTLHTYEMRQQGNFTRDNKSSICQAGIISTIPEQISKRADA
jgi:hypothetical protein